MTIPVDYFFWDPVSQASVLGAAAVVSNINGPENTGIERFVTSMYIPGDANACEFDISGQGYTDVWVRVLQMANGVTADIPFLELIGDQGNTLARLVSVGTSGDWKVEYNNGAGFTQVGSNITTQSINTGFSFARLIEVHFVLSNSGELTVYEQGGELVSVTATDTLNTADTTIDTLKLTGPSNNASWAQFGGVCVDGADLRTLRLDAQIPNNDGGETDFVNNRFYVDEHVGGFNDADFILTDAAGENETFLFPPLSALVDGASVDGVCLLFRARAVTDPGLFLRGIGRRAGSNYDGDNSEQPVAAGGFSSRYKLDFLNNPETAAAWTDQAEVEAMEFGFNSRATA